MTEAANQILGQLFIYGMAGVVSLLSALLFGMNKRVERNKEDINKLRENVNDKIATLSSDLKLNTQKDEHIDDQLTKINTKLEEMTRLFNELIINNNGKV